MEQLGREIGCTVQIPRAMLCSPPVSRLAFCPSISPTFACCIYVDGYVFLRKGTDKDTLGETETSVQMLIHRA